MSLTIGAAFECECHMGLIPSSEAPSYRDEIDSKAAKCAYGDAIQSASGYLGQLRHQEKALKQAGTSAAEIAESTAEARAAYYRAMETVRELGIKAKIAADEAVGYARTHLGDAPAKGIARAISDQPRKVPFAKRYLISELDEAVAHKVAAEESATVAKYVARTSAAEAAEQVAGKTLAKRIITGTVLGTFTSVVIQAGLMFFFALMKFNNIISGTLLVQEHPRLFLRGLSEGLFHSHFLHQLHRRWLQR